MLLLQYFCYNSFSQQSSQDHEEYEVFVVYTFSIVGLSKFLNDEKIKHELDQ